MLRILVILAAISVALPSLGQEAKWKKWEVQADTMMNQQNFEAAIKLYGKVIKSSKLEDKAAYPSVYKRAVCYYSIGKLEESLKDLELFIPEYPGVLQGYILKAFVYRDLGDLEALQATIDQALVIQPGDPSLIKWRAGIYLDMGEYEKVMEDMLYVRAIQNDPEVESYLGFAFYNLDQPDSAIQAMNRAIELDATYLPAYLYGGSFSLQEGNNELALKYLNVALRLDPSNTTAQFYKGVALVELEREDEACSILSKAFYAGEDDAGDYLKEYCYKLQN
ncbi:MAG: tetratricopeptide repeat protein [Cytophagales bacterium]